MIECFSSDKLTFSDLTFNGSVKQNCSPDPQEDGEWYDSQENNSDFSSNY